MSKTFTMPTIDVEVRLDQFDLNDIEEYLREESPELFEHEDGPELSEMDTDDILEECGNRDLKVAQIDGVKDELKYDFFMENFDKITLEQLEALVK